MRLHMRSCGCSCCGGARQAEGGDARGDAHRRGRRIERAGTAGREKEGRQPAGASTSTSTSTSSRHRVSKRALLRLSLASAAAVEAHALPRPAAAASASRPLRVPSRMSVALPRDGAIALRRALPRLDPDLGEASSQIDEALRLLRIPQRKPFDEVARCAGRATAALERARAGLASLTIADSLDGRAAAAIGLTAEMARAAAERDAPRTTARAVAAQEQIAGLLVGLMPDLPFLLPARFSGLPRCTGRAEVGLTILAGDAPEGGEAIDIVITVDGFNAPLTAGSFLKNVSDGVYDGLRLQKFDSSNSIVAAVGGAAAAPLALEMSVMGESEPRYNEPLDIQGADEYVSNIFRFQMLFYLSFGCLPSPRAGQT